MDEQLRKRLEEAAREYAKRVVPECISSYEDFFNNTVADFRNGAELGYKEAIAQAKEWLIDHFSAAVECNENGVPLEKSYIEGRKLAIEMLTDFETYMNKLLEEKK